MNETLIAVIFDAITGESIERPLTEEEIVYSEAMQADEEAREAERIAKEEAKANGMAKLIALGLTEEEAGALIG
jgi:hypothetical protein